MLSKIWFWDPRSGIRKKPIWDPGVTMAPDPGSATLVFCKKGVKLRAFDGIVLGKARPIMCVQYCMSSDSKFLYENYKTYPVLLYTFQKMD
jgi:hypothetical protein